MGIEQRLLRQSSIGTEHIFTGDVDKNDPSKIFKSAKDKAETTVIYRTHRDEPFIRNPNRLILFIIKWFGVYSNTQIIYTYLHQPPYYSRV